jgi:hypothetical protein
MCLSHDERQPLLRLPLGAQSHAAAVDEEGAEDVPVDEEWKGYS